MSDLADFPGRVRALAIMHLTRRNDLLVREDIREPGKVLDLAVDIIDPNKPGRRRFGVYLQGTKSPVNLAHANHVLGPSLARFQQSGEVPYPYCLFYFTMEDNQRYTIWAAEPIVDEDDQPRLHYRDEADCVRLDGAALDRIVDRIHQWYDAFYAAIRA